MVKVRTMASPCWCAARSVTRCGVMGWRGTGSPTAPHPARSAAPRRGRAARKRRQSRVPAGWSGKREVTAGISGSRRLKDVAAQVLVLGNVGKLLGDIGGVHLDALFLELGSIEGDFVEH